METTSLINFGYMTYVIVMCLIACIGSFVFRDYIVTTLVFIIGMLLFVSTVIKSQIINIGLAVCFSLLMLIGIVRGIKKIQHRS